MALGNDWPKKLLNSLKKYKYLVLMLVLGVGILLLPIGGGEKEAEAPVPEEALSDEEYAEKMERRLEELLSMVEGAGQVRVMLTLQKGSSTQYQTDVQTSQDENRTSEDRKTVILSEGSAYDKAAISAVEYPRFQGALILSEGAQRPAVCLDLVSAVAALTGLSTSQITVVKLK